MADASEKPMQHEIGLRAIESTKRAGAGLALVAVALGAALVPAATVAGDLCIGNAELSACLENGWEYGSVAGAWTSPPATASLTPEERDRLEDTYRAVLGRDPDRDGLETYARALQQGWSFDKVRWALANSAEAETRIDQIYRDLLDRRADADGLATYREMLERGWELKRVRRDIARSDEARQRRAAFSLSLAY